MVERIAKAQALAWAYALIASAFSIYLLGLLAPGGLLLKVAAEAAAFCFLGTGASWAIAALLVPFSILEDIL